MSQTPADRQIAMDAVRTLLQALGQDVDSPDMADTPRRVADMYAHFFRGTNGSWASQPPPRLAMFPNAEQYDEMVLLKDIDYVSVCSHHLLPFVGRAHIAYAPDQTLLGISKLARIVDYYAARPQLQERLAKQVADGLMSLVKPRGVAVYFEGSHGCIACRGAMKPASRMVTSVMTGVFQDVGSTWRDEFLAAVR